MTLPIPSYISDAGIDSLEIRYLWDDWASKKSIYRRDGDESLLNRTRALSQRGRMAFVNGVAEWLIYRFESLLDSTLPLDALEAAWAAIVDRRYALPLASIHDKGEWSGPIKGVIRRGLLFVQDTIDLGWTNGDNARLSLKITNLTRYVLPQTCNFENWIEIIFNRLRVLSILDGKDFVGEAIPREALDYNHDFDPNETETLIQGFLGTIARSKNPYLATREMMLEWGFSGEPYTFDINRDREIRQNFSGI